MLQLRPSILYHILLISEEPKFVDVVGRALQEDGYPTNVACSVAESWAIILKQTPDLIILNSKLTDMDGIALCRTLRQAGYKIPILILTSDSAKDRIAGFEAGADSCLNNTLEVSELLARVRALLRRAETHKHLVLSYSNLRLDLRRREVRRGGRVLQLDRTEFDLLKFFLNHPGQVFTKDYIIVHLWGYDYDPESNVLEVYIHHLRRKLGTPSLIETVRNVGYVLRETLLEPQ